MKIARTAICMRRTLNYFGVFLIVSQSSLMACAGLVHANRSEKSVAVQREETGASPESNSQQRDFVPLSGAEMKDALIGYKHTVDRDTEWSSNRTSIGFSEEFLADGTWTTTRFMTAVDTKTGTWRIDNDQICIRVAGGEDVCRQVWRDKISGRIAMFDAYSSRRVVIILTSSSLK